MILSKKKKQRGQSLLYVSILIVVLMSGVFFVYDIGTIVNNKIKFQNGADAAALSAVAVKISKHHTEAMVRTSMFHESLAAQAQQRAAQALLLKILLAVKTATANTPAPGDISITPPYTGGGGIGGPKPITPAPPTFIGVPGDMLKDVDDYKKYANLTYKHVTKLHREKKALEGYYNWLADINGAGPQAVIETARIGLRGNTFGLYSTKTSGSPDNLRILSDKNDLIENQGKFGEIGGVPYANEGANKVGNFGKTFVEFDGTGVVSTQGTSLLKYFNKVNLYTLKTNAAARVTSSEELGMKKTPMNSISASVPFNMLWYSPRLMSIFKNTDSSLH